MVGISAHYFHIIGCRNSKVGTGWLLLRNSYYVVYDNGIKLATFLTEPMASYFLVVSLNCVRPTDILPEQSTHPFWERDTIGEASKTLRSEYDHTSSCRIRPILIVYTVYYETKYEYTVYYTVYSCLVSQHYSFEKKVVSWNRFHHWRFLSLRISLNMRLWSPSNEVNPLSTQKVI